MVWRGELAVEQSAHHGGHRGALRESPDEPLRCQYSDEREWHRPNNETDPSYSFASSLLCTTNAVAQSGPAPPGSGNQGEQPVCTFPTQLNGLLHKWKRVRRIRSRT